ncbi:MAG: NAD(+) synthase [Elusimicrobiota bacterium]|jgi:NAD+ synthase (glutamine-hydrolysing)|nr:NAD(+) synthase [Elusimicrobiota bacterium]
MRFSFIKTAAITPKTHLANPSKNADEIIKLLDKAESMSVELAVFPELCISGYTCGELFLSETLIKASLEAIGKILQASKNKKVLFFIGAPIVFNGKLFSCAVAVQKGKILAVVPKTAMPNYGEFYEVRHFASGEYIDGFIDVLGQSVYFGTNVIFESSQNKTVKIAAEICEDMFVPSPPSSRHAQAGANIIVNLSASNELIAKSDYRKTLINSQSGRLAAGYVYASAGLGESTSDMIFSGHRIIAENGVVLSESGLFESGITIADIDVGRLEFERRRLNVFHIDNSLYAKVSFDFDEKNFVLDRYFSPHPFVPSDKEGMQKRAELILQMLSYALSERLQKTGLEAVIGISGGLDSTLALLVILRAYEKLNRDKKNIIAVTMPGPGTGQKTLSNVLALSKAVGINICKIPITEIVDKHLADIGHNKKDIAYENAQARERTQILMDIANARKGIVVGTGDLSEIALGWATYNGDHMSMYGINSSVPKTLVKYLVDYEAQRVKNYQQALVDVLNTEISPELLPNKDGKISQKTESILGPYEAHDFFLYYTIRFGMAPSKIFALAKNAFKDKYTAPQIKKYLIVFINRFFKNQFKRNAMPDGVKIGSISLSPRADWRMPSDAEIEAYIDDLNRSKN